jgi:hypothetical protein
MPLDVLPSRVCAHQAQPVANVIQTLQVWGRIAILNKGPDTHGAACDMEGGLGKALQGRRGSDEHG